ncbi:YdcF family protein [Propionicicella superfundia]|uniref:YdcF family protein n=1 Tax=Propionicicella superfundia TaxID=348582 RepID=UPI0006847E08|nr:YdcF family protein [Propionicicella superfundia]
MRGTIGLAGAAALGYALLVEGRHWSANRHLPAPSAAARALLVLGCPPNADGSLGATQRWRVDLALRAWRPGDRVVFSGAALSGLPSEADVMAAYARRCGVPAAAIVCETRARSTWENMLFGADAVRDAPEVMIVSDPLHARRALRMLRRQDPAVATRVVRLPGYRFGEHPWRKTVSAVFESPLKPVVLWVHNRSRTHRGVTARL